VYLGHRTAQEISNEESGDKLGLKMGKPVMLSPFHKRDLVPTRGRGSENFGLHMAEQKH